MRRKRDTRKKGKVKKKAVKIDTKKQTKLFRKGQAGTSLQSGI